MDPKAGNSETLNSDALTPEQVINLDAYPLQDPGSEAFARIAAQAKRELDAKQYVVLPDFIRQEARHKAVEQIETVLPAANHNASTRNCYLQRRKDPALPDDHPRNILFPASTWMLAADRLPADNPLKTMYYWQNMIDFIGRIVGTEQLYANDDPMQPVNAVCYKDGDQSAWHFDSVNAFTMTLMLQAPNAGGRFEIIPNTRRDDDECVDRVRQAVQGNSDDCVEVAREEGALCIFRGCNSLHRVSPVAGNRMRIMGVFVYEKEPGVIGDSEVNETVYGRATTAAE